jgi:surfactin synthase thioesterase subunit
MSAEHPAIVIFPGAGSFGAEFRQLLDECGPSAWVVRYPGRFGKDLGRSARSFEGVMQACLAQVQERDPVLPVLVGHSFGAYVAYATAQELERQGAGISALVVLGATAPSLLSIPESATLDRSGVADFLGEVAVSLLSDEFSAEWRDIILDTAVHDLRSLLGFIASDHHEVRCPILAACGETDPLASLSGIENWASATESWWACKVFPGGHPDMLATPELASWVRLVLRTNSADSTAR